MSEEVGFSDWYIKDAPQTLNGVFGQPKVVEHIRGCQQKRVFDRNTLFTGQYGSGKTVLAKILAKSIACKNVNEKGEPCNTCPTCMAINDETFGRDVVYMDAEQMSAEDVRKKVEETMQAPIIRDAAKVIICDEAQALSKEGVEAFLTATQNPRPKTFFIFTAMSKLQGAKAGALESRCKVWPLKNPTPDKLYEYLGKVCMAKGLTKEGDIPQTFFTEGLQFIAENSEQSYRKALQNLEQCYTARIFDKKEIAETLNIVSYEDTARMLTEVANGKVSENVWAALTGEGYQDKFNLLLKIIGDACAVDACGLEYVDEDQRWKWNQAVALSKAPYFKEIVEAFTSLSSRAYIKRGDWEIAISKIIKSKAGITEVPTAGRRRPS